MFKNILSILVILIILAGGYFLYNAGSEESSVSEDVQTYFTEEMREIAVSRVGQPIEGFEPLMLIQAFPDLVPQDFDKVEALLGEYSYSRGEIVFELDTSQPEHSAARAISDEGMETLLSNILKRTGSEADTTEDIDNLLNSLSATNGGENNGGGNGNSNNGGGHTWIECKPEQREAEACIQVYQPVCARVQVECVTEPCNPVEETISNSCFACMNDRVISYREGECEA